MHLSAAARVNFRKPQFMVPSLSLSYTHLVSGSYQNIARHLEVLFYQLGLLLDYLFHVRFPSQVLTSVLISCLRQGSSPRLCSIVYPILKCHP